MQDLKKTINAQHPRHVTDAGAKWSIKITIHLHACQPPMLKTDNLVGQDCSFGLNFLVSVFAIYLTPDPTTVSKQGPS